MESHSLHSPAFYLPGAARGSWLPARVLSRLWRPQINRAPRNAGPGQAASGPRREGWPEWGEVGCHLAWLGPQRPMGSPRLCQASVDMACRCCSALLACPQTPQEGRAGHSCLEEACLGQLYSSCALVAAART